MNDRFGGMRVEVLGPWLAAPAAGESGACSSYVVSGDSGNGSAGGATVLLDCGPGAAAELQRRDLTRRLDAIVVSHMDADHVLGLAPLANLRLASGLISGPRGYPRIRLLVPEEDGADLLCALEAVFSRVEDRPGGVGSGGGGAPPDGLFSAAFDIVGYSEDDELDLKGMNVSFRRTRHHRPCFSPRIGNGGATVVYSADTGYEVGMVSHARDADLFLCEATLLERHPHWTETHGHLTGELAGKMAREAGVGRLVLTHLGPDQETNAANLQRARAEFGGAVELARTGSVFHIRGRLDGAEE